MRHLPIWQMQRTLGSVRLRAQSAIVRSLPPVPAPIAPSRTLGRRLRDARKAKGLTQAELGAVLGLEDENTAAPRISRYERGDRMPDEKTMEVLAEALELPVAYFHATSDVMAEAILLISRLPAAKQREVISKLRDWAGKEGK